MDNFYVKFFTLLHQHTTRRQRLVKEFAMFNPRETYELDILTDAELQNLIDDLQVAQERGILDDDVLNSIVEGYLYD